jgi:hypothetical protein
MSGNRDNTFRICITLWGAQGISPNLSDRLVGNPSPGVRNLGLEADHSSSSTTRPGLKIGEAVSSVLHI